MENFTLAVQGLAGFDSVFRGLFTGLQDNGMMPKAFSSAGAGIRPCMEFSAGLDMKDCVAKLQEANRFSSAPKALDYYPMLNYQNSFYRTLYPIELCQEMYSRFLQNPTGSPQDWLPPVFKYTYDITKLSELQTKMEVPVYSTILDLLAGKTHTIDMRTYDYEKYKYALGTRVPYFPAQKVEDTYYIEGFFDNPPFKPLVDSGHNKLIVIKSCRTKAEFPKTYMEQEDRITELYFNNHVEENLRYIRKINRWVKEGLLPKEKYREISVESLNIEATPDDYADYTPAGIERKFELGRKHAKDLVQLVKA